MYVAYVEGFYNNFKTLLSMHLSICMYVYLVRFTYLLCMYVRMYVCMHVCVKILHLRKISDVLKKVSSKGRYVVRITYAVYVCMNVCLYVYMHAVQIVLRLWKQLDAHGIEYLKDADHREAAGSIYTYIHIHR